MHTCESGGRKIKGERRDTFSQISQQTKIWHTGEPLALACSQTIEGVSKKGLFVFRGKKISNTNNAWPDSVTVEARGTKKKNNDNNPAATLCNKQHR